MPSRVNALSDILRAERSAFRYSRGRTSLLYFSTMSSFPFPADFAIDSRVLSACRKYCSINSSSVTRPA